MAYEKRISGAHGTDGCVLRRSGDGHMVWHLLVNPKKESEAAG